MKLNHITYMPRRRARGSSEVKNNRLDGTENTNVRKSDTSVVHIQCKDIPHEYMFDVLTAISHSQSQFAHNHYNLDLKIGLAFFDKWNLEISNPKLQHPT